MNLGVRFGVTLFYGSICGDFLSLSISEDTSSANMVTYSHFSYNLNLNQIKCYKLAQQMLVITLDYLS